MGIRKRKDRFELPLVIPPAQPLELLQGSLPVAQWVRVSPQQALHWLGESNIDNRSLREYHVLALAADMEAQVWDLNGDAIKFDTNNRLVEGQHRLRACVESNTSFDTLLITGLDPEAYDTSGIGIKKIFADMLRGEKNKLQLASTIKLVYFWTAGLLENAYSRALPTYPELKVTFHEHPKVRDSVNRVAGFAARKLLNPSFIGLIHYAATLEGRAATVESFFERLGSGLGFLNTDPVYHLHRFLSDQRSIQPGSKTGRADPNYVLALTLKAWNASKNGQIMRQLGRRNDEQYPPL